MMRNLKYRTFTTLTGVIYCTVPSCDIQGSLEGSKPNILFILADDLSYGDLSCNNQKHFSTPNIDRLANGGIRFVQAYSGSPESAPSRCSLMTGMHMGHSRIRANESARGQDHLVSGDVTVAEVLKEAGYVTGIVGKWGIGLPGTEGTPDKQGFDHSFGFYDQLSAHTYYPYYLMRNGKAEAIPENYGFNMERLYKHTSDSTGEYDNFYNSDGKLLPAGIKDPSKAKYSEDLFEKEALEFLKLNRYKPFFLYYATQLPHGPNISDDLGQFLGTDWDQKHREWASMVTRMDKSVGSIISLLEELDILDKTIIFFASDNGYSQWGYFGRKPHEDDPLFKNKGPWPGGKFNCSNEGGMRIPFFVYWKGRINAAITDHITTLHDFMATAADLAGIKDIKTDGISLVPVLSGKPDKQKEHDYLYWENGTFSKQTQSLRMGKWWAYRPTPGDSIRLYDLTEDMLCSTDLARENQGTISEIERIFTHEHLDSEWYRNPGESNEAVALKKQKAADEGTLQTPAIPNKKTAEEINSSIGLAPR